MQREQYKPPGGVYVLRDNGEVVYVGKTNDIFRRISEHSRGGQKHGISHKKFTDWEYFRLENEEQRKILEALLIVYLHPKYNIADERQMRMIVNSYHQERERQRKANFMAIADYIEKALFGCADE